MERSGCERLEPRLLLAADLSISKSQIAPIAGAAVSQGELISYQITVANNGSAAATNTTVNDTLPAGETLIGASTSTSVPLSISGNNLTVNLGTINAGANATVTIDALVNGQVAGALTNTASVSSPDDNNGVPIVSAPVSTTINALTSGAADLSIRKTAANNNAAVSVGGNETYTITITNNSANAANNVTVLDALPTGATLVSGSETGGSSGSFTLAGNLETVGLGTIGAHNSATVTLSVTAPTNAGVMVNTATVATSTGNTAAGNATATVTTGVQGTTAPGAGSVDLAVTKSAAVNSNTANTGINVGANAVYTITVTNIGTAAATGVVVSDVLPADAQFISGTTSIAGVNVSSTGGIATATLPTLAAGASATLTLTLTPSVVGALTNSVVVESDQPDNNQANNVASATSLVVGAATPSVDLSVTKSASASTGAVGTNEVYTITIANNSATTATGVVASDVLPSNATFVSATTSAGGSLNASNGVLTDHIGTLAAGTSQTITVTVTPTAVGVITDAAYVAGDQLDTSLANNIATVSTPVQGTTAANVNLAITKTAAGNNANVALGANETYTITVTNNGTDSATGVVVSDVLPTTATFVSGTASVNGVSVNNVNGTVSANLGTLAAGANATITLTVSPTVAGSITDTAFVESSDVDVNQANNSATVTTQVVSAATQANLSIIKIATPSPDTAGQNLTYTLIITNTGQAAADNVVVSDTLPGTATFVSGSTDVNGATVVNNNGTVTADLGTVPSGAIDMLTIIVTPTATGTLSNTATIATTTSNVSTHTSATVTTTINPAANAQANLSIIKVAAPSPGTVGQNLTYTLIVINTGAVAADNVVVSDALPAGATFVSDSTDVNGATVTNTNGTITANLGSVASGAIDTLTIIVTPTASGTLTNTATVATTTPNVSTHTSATVTTTINPSTSNQANLSITKTASPSPVTVGQNLTYTITVSNAVGAATAAGVTVTDVLPSGLNLVSVSDSLGHTLTSNNTTIVNSNGTITDNLGNVTAGANDTLTIVVTPSQAGTLTNTATVATSTANTSQNTSATVQTTVNPSNANQADLSITKTASPSPVTVGQNLTYTITVSNAVGAATAAGVTVTDVLPSGLNLVSVSDSLGHTLTSNNTTIVNSNGTIADNLGNVTAGANDTLTIVVTPSQAGTLTNTATVATSTANTSQNTAATVQTTVNPSNANQADLSITKTASPSPGTVGQNLTYTIVVTNAAGAATAEGVTVIDTLPVGLADLVSATDTTRNVTLTATGAAIKDQIGTMAAGTSDTIVIVATPTKTGQITNTATVTTTSPNASNDTTAVVHTMINPSTTNGQSCFLNGQAGDNTDQTFLTNLYRELFDREPDADGFQNWLHFLQTNGGTTAAGQSTAATRQELIQIFLGSQEYETHWVDCVFDAFLVRHAEKGAENFFVNQLNHGASEQSILITILSSPEYLSHPGHGPGGKGKPGNSNDAFVDNLYTDLLGRTADQSSEQAWLNALNSGQLTRAQVVQAFLTTPEEAHDLLIAAGAGAVGAPGTPATGSYPLAVITGDGWDNLYFQGNLQNLNASAVDQFMNELEAGTAWQTVQQQMLALPQYYNAV